MRRFFQVFKLMLSNAWTWRHPGLWDDGDAGKLRAFLASPTGMRLAMTLRNASIEANASAVAQASPHANGMAYGMIAAIRYIETLSRPVAPQDDESETSANGAAVNLDHLAP